MTLTAKHDLVLRVQKALMLAIGLFALLQVYSVGLTNDTVTLLYFTKHMLLDGGLYTQYIEMNPPFFYVLYAIPMFIIKYTGFSDGVVINFYVMLACLLSLYGTHITLQQTTLSQVKKWNMLLLQAWVLFVLPIQYLVYADREHLLFVFAFPWLIASIFQVAPRWWVSVMAGIGFCIKPYNAIIFILMALMSGYGKQPFLKRVFTPSHIIIGAIGMTYIVCLLLIYPSYIDVSRMTMGAYDVLSFTLSSKREVIINMAAIAFLPLIFVPFRNIRNWLLLFIAGSLVFMCNAGWTYTRYLFAVPIAMIYGCWLMGIFSPEHEPPSRPVPPLRKTFYTRLKNIIRHIKSWLLVARIIPLCALAYISYDAYKALKYNMYTTSYSGYSSNYTYINPQLLSELRSEAGEHFILFALDIWGANIARLHNTPNHIYPYDYLWPLPLAVQRAGSEEGERAKDALFETFKTSVNNYPDATLIIDRSEYKRGLPENFDIFGFFMQDAEFRRIMDGYYLANRIDKCAEYGHKIRCAFDVWKPK